MLVEAEYDNAEGKLIPGMFGQASITLLLATVYAVSNLLSDIVIALLDPRVRYA